MKKKIVVPEGMLKAVHDRVQPHGTPMEDALQAALRWLSENPIVPRVQDMDEWRGKWPHVGETVLREFVDWFQRRMFLAPEPNIPEELRRISDRYHNSESVDRVLLEAYFLGKKAGESR